MLNGAWCGGTPAHLTNGTRVAPRNARGTYERAELHQRLIVRPSVAFAARQYRLGDAPELLLATRRFGVERGRKYPSQHARDVRVYQRRAYLIGERRDRSRGVGTDAR